MSVSRRDILLGLAGVGVVGCTAPRPEEPPREEEPPPDTEPKKPPGPRVHLPAGPTAQHVLIADSHGIGSGGHLTVYGDGLALYYRRGGDRRRLPPVQLLRLAPDELGGLRALLAAPGFVGAADESARTMIKDGGRLRLAVGDRRISLHGGAVPPEVAAVRDHVDALEQRLTDDGQDAFAAAEPRLLVVHDRWHTAANTADRLIVWANGVLDYRIVDSDSPDGADAGSPDPIVRLEQAAPADIAELAGLLAGSAFTTAPSNWDIEGDLSSSGTTHFLMFAGPPSSRSRPASARRPGCARCSPPSPGWSPASTPRPTSPSSTGRRAEPPRLRALTSRRRRPA